MRTNIVLDEALIEKAQELTGLKTKRAVVDEALRMLIQVYEQAEVRALRGQLRWEGDIDAARLARISEQSSC
ncbi:MAG TPA: type II toxin-antitoxin system VapB family antitoxin [Chloroflexi bacterium]|nr:type II toxin-antitoxin system VapB family antitoxin [Chloroflexota bacterium]